MCKRIDAFVRESPANRLIHLDGSPIFESPVVGFADGDDPLFQQYKTIIALFHLTPREVMQRIADQNATTTHTSSDRLSVISWILPIARTTRISNRAQDQVPSIEWAYTRNYGEQFNDVVRRYVVDLLQSAGYSAVAPAISSLFRVHYDGLESPPASNWSERHIAYVAGLGTFSLSDGFITARGIAMRCGSVVTNLPLQPSPRPHENHIANCLYLWEGTCGACIDRCPAGAISTEGHDKMKCREYISQQVGPYQQVYGVENTGCGLCQAGVPCEAGIPPRRERSNEP
ncbi:MAG: hypothetical protein A2Y73_01805 [Chloroflexi bacterium RBG_13_56_8]|nr:MAG: hypothetical protein A2Y73_01805 [Chloroflexi bacterium RBG_13_56_8]